MAIQVFVNEPIGGVTDQSRRLWYGKQISFSLIRGQRGTASIPFFIAAAESYEAAIGSPIFIHEIVEDVDTVVFAGTIDSWSREWIGNDGDHCDTLACVSLEQVFDTIRILPASFQTMITAGAVFSALFTEFASDTPLSLGTVQDGATVGISPANPYTPAPWARLSDVFNDLAALCTNFIWFVDPATLTVNFQAQDTTPAAFTVTSYLFETGDWKQQRSDFRDEQQIQIAFEAFTPSNELFDGNGANVDYNLVYYIERVLSVTATTSVRASVGWSFAPGSPPTDGNPVDGDTFTISGPTGSRTYTFVDILDNAIRDQILIGANPGDTANNVWYALWAIYTRRGVNYSWPTWENEVAIIVTFPDGATSGVLTCKLPGEGGNALSVSTTSAHFTWGGGFAGGVDGQSFSLQAGVQVGGIIPTGVDAFYTRGANYLTTRQPIPFGTSLSVCYYRLGADTIVVQDSALVALRAAAEHGSGIYSQLLSDTTIKDPVGAYKMALQILNQFKSLPKSFQFTIDQALLSPGQLLQVIVASPTGADTLLDGEWLVQQVDAQIIPGMETLPEPYGHFRYTITVINVPIIGTHIDFLNSALTPAPTIQIPPTAPSVATPSFTPDVTTGAPTAQQTGPSGQQWVQETLAISILAESDDLVVDDVDDTIVSSATYTFTADDVGHTLDILGSSPAPWGHSTYTILSVAGGAATLNSSPAPVSTTGGHFTVINPSIYQFSWIPMLSSWTQNQIALIHKLVPDGGSPVLYATHKLTPFRYAQQGYHIDPIDPDLGPDYTITSGRITLKTQPEDGAILIAEYFPAGPVPRTEDLPSGTDLVIVSSFGDFGQKYSSASHVFTTDEEGLVIVVTGGTGWTPGGYALDVVVGGDAATNFGNAGLVGITGGIWHLSH